MKTYERQLGAYSSVTLLRPITTNGVTYPTGTTGVIVECYEDGRSYALEVEHPFAIVTVTVDDIADGATFS